MTDRPNTEPLRTASGAIVVDEAQRKLDAAKAAFRKAYDRGYILSQKGELGRSQAILDRANAALREAEAEYAEARGRYDHLPSSERCSTCGQPDNCGDCNHN